MNDDFTPQTQLESDRGGSGRSRRTGIGAGGRGGPGGTQNQSSDDDSESRDKPKAIICDRSLSVRAGLSVLLRSLVDIVDHTDSMETLLKLIEIHRPQVIITDIDLNDFDPVREFGLTFKLARIFNFIVLTDSYWATKYYHQLLNVGVRLVCLKKTLPETIADAVALAISTREASYCDPTLASLLEQPALKAALSMYKVSNTEFEVLLRLDLRNAEIASELGIGHRQVKYCVEALLAKLKVSTRTSLALKVVQLGGTILPCMPARDPATGENIEVRNLERICEDVILDSSCRSIRKLQYLYSENKKFRLIDQLSFKEHLVGSDKFAGVLQFLQEGQENLKGLFLGGRLICVRLPERVVLTLIQTNELSDNNNCFVGTLANGSEIRLPFFIEPGSKLEIDPHRGVFVKIS